MNTWKQLRAVLLLPDTVTIAILATIRYFTAHPILPIALEHRPAGHRLPCPLPRPDPGGLDDSTFHDGWQRHARSVEPATAARRRGHLSPRPIQ